MPAPVFQVSTPLTPNENDREILWSFFKNNCAVNQCKKSVVFAHTHIFVRIMCCTSLPDNDVSRRGKRARDRHARRAHDREVPERRRPAHRPRERDRPARARDQPAAVRRARTHSPDPRPGAGRGRGRAIREAGRRGGGRGGGHDLRLGPEGGHGQPGRSRWNREADPQEAEEPRRLGP